MTRRLPSFKPIEYFFSKLDSMDWYVCRWAFVRGMGFLKPRGPSPGVEGIAPPSARAEGGSLYLNPAKLLNAASAASCSSSPWIRASGRDPSSRSSRSLVSRTPSSFT